MRRPVPSSICTSRSASVKPPNICEIGLRDVEGVGFEKGLELLAGGEAQVADADGNGRGGTKPRVLLHIVERERRLDPGEIQIGQQIEVGRQLFEARVLLRDIEHQAAVLAPQGSRK